MGLTRDSSGSVSCVSFNAVSLNPPEEVGDDGADDESDTASASGRRGD